MNEEMQELAKAAYYSKRNVFEYHGKGFHLCFISQHFNGKSKVIALEIRTCDYDAGKWITVGTLKL